MESSAENVSELHAKNIESNVNTSNEPPVPVDEETLKAYQKYQQWIASGEHLNEHNEQNEDVRIKTDADGVVWKWDHISKVWYPQIDEELYIKQQEAYVAPEKPADKPAEKRKEKKYLKKLGNQMLKIQVYSLLGFL